MIASSLVANGARAAESQFYIPPKPQRALRELTRYRTTLVRERARVVNRVEKLFESMNIKLSSVVTDLMGESAKAMLTKIAQGAADAHALAQLATGASGPRSKSWKQL